MSSLRFPNWKWPLALLAIAAITSAAYVRHLGYYGGPVYSALGARRAAGPDLAGTAAIFLSGDMGFNTGMGPRIAARIADHGIPVIAVNSLSAFSTGRSPDYAAALVRSATEKALALPNIRNVVLIGQSFGANILIYGAERLPPSLKQKVRMIELVVPTDTTLFRATPGGIIELGKKIPALTIARDLTSLPALCVNGETEAESLCPLWNQPNVERVTLPGDHFLHEDDALVAATLLHALRPDPASMQ